MIKYKILQKTKFLDMKVSYDVEIGLVEDRLPTESEILEIARKLRSRKHQRTFVCFYLPGMVVDSGAFATGHSTPETTVRVMDFAVPQRYKHLVADRID